MEIGLVVEVDGGQHAEREEADRLRSERLQGDGYRVLRFWNHEVLGSTDAVLEKISRTIEESRAARRKRVRTKSVESPSPRPSPVRARGRI
jgi:very-short-patch-repair endonuclease